jgi:hypothetical protein
MVQYSVVDHAFGLAADPPRRGVLERLSAASASIGWLGRALRLVAERNEDAHPAARGGELVATERSAVPAGACLCLTPPRHQRLDRFAQVVEPTKGAR